MKFSLCYFHSIFLLFLSPLLAFGQAPNLGSLTGFAVFTAVGEITNTGNTVITGDVGTDAGAFTGFLPGIVNGQVFLHDMTTAQAALDVGLAFSALSSATCGMVLAVGMGNDQTLTPNTYCIGAAATLAGNLILDGQFDPDAVFIIQIDGAFASGISSQIVLINGADPCNVYWQINGAVSLGGNSIFRGTIVANGAITLQENATLWGRALSREGAIHLHNNAVDANMQPTAAVIIAGSDTAFCFGEEVVLSGNVSGVWSTGETSPTITVTTSGEYFVTTTNDCGSSISNVIIVTVNQLPICTIIGENFFCEGGSTQLCAPPGAAAYLWSTGAITPCISVGIAGNYSVTVTDLGGCSSICAILVTESPAPICNITGENFFCEGGSTQLCAPPGAAAYLWSTGAITPCISVSIAGNYSVTVTDLGGCNSICAILVTESPAPICTITGENFFCEGGSTQLCAPPGAAAYLWSTGAITPCISVSIAGNYSVTVTDLGGCSSICSAIVTVVPLPVITCPPAISVECNDSLLPIDTGMATSTDSPAPMITFSDATELGLCANTFTVTRTWTATNVCGGVSSCIQMLSIIDTTPPLVECPPNLTVPCADQVPTIATTAATSDNCGSAVTFTHVGDRVSSLICADNFTLTRNYLATDDCGNATACVQTITVLDDMPPTIAFSDPLLQDGDTLQVQCYGQDPNWDLPLFDVASVVADDFCAGAVTLVFNQYQLGSGVCENGIIDLFRLSWVATDACDNADSVSIFVALVDTIAPVIYGVPADITVSCNEIPAITEVIFATDECLCACILAVEESSLTDDCLNGQVILRTWTAKDECGNLTTATQTITLVDEAGPTFVVARPDMQGMGNGAILNYTCAEGGIPTFLEEPNALFALDAGTCGGANMLSFDMDITIADDCQALGFVEQRTYTWVAADNCGNTTTMTLFVRLMDTEAPVFWGVPDTTCLVSPWLDNVAVTDDCDRFNVVFEDFDLPNPCGGGSAILRIYEAFDNCGNTARDTSILIPNDATALVMAFTNPVLAAIGTGDTLTLNCDVQNGQYTAFGTDDVEIEGACVGTNLAFSEVLIAAGDCLSNGVIATVALRWTATDFCGNSLERVIIANIVDDTAPIFIDFLPELTIGCNAELPPLYAMDNCGAITFQTTWDSIIVSNCAAVYELRRLVTATDACANTTTQLQIIHVGNGDGPTFAGITDVVCDDATLPDVTAFDACSGQLVAVSMQADTLVSPCGGTIIERIWTATDSCGNTSTGHQTVIINDTVPPVIIVPANTFVASYLEGNYNAVYLSQADQLYELGELDASSVYIGGACDERMTIQFTVDILKTDNCLDSGYVQRRTYMWEATDACGNATIVFFVVHIFDDVPPVFVDAPADLTVVCAPLPAVQPMVAEDSAPPVTIVFSATIVPAGTPGSFTVTRTWTATDACGNVAVYTQTILWIPDTLVECNINTPNRVACNTHSVLICSDNTSNTDGSTYHWEITGDDCFIQASPDTECTLIYIGWSAVEIALTVTDRYGCVSTCTETLDCQFAFDDSFYTLPLAAERGLEANAGATGSIPANHLHDLSVYPNPAVGSVNLRFESLQQDEVAFSVVNLLGELVAQGQIMAQLGTNTHPVDVSHLPQGSYLMQLKTKAELHTKVIVVMRQD